MSSKERYKTIFIGLAIAINLIGGFIALTLKLPIYLDTIGTILVSVMFGPVGGAMAGGLTSIVNGITFDPISFYFIPVQIVLGLVTGVLVKEKKFCGFKTILQVALITVISSSVSSVIAAFVFNGVTSSGSSILVAVLKNSGISIVTAVFSTQIFTDLLDKAISFAVVFATIKIMPFNMKNLIIRN